MTAAPSRTSATGIDLIKSFEGFRASAYRDPVGVWTIGWGFTRGVRAGDTITRAQADQRLLSELAQYEAAVYAATAGAPTTQPQFDALVSLAYNIGIAGLQRSTALRRHREGQHNAAARAFALWNQAGGRVLPGLTRRRAAEAALYLTPVGGPSALDMPRGVDPERPLAASEINRAASLAGGTAAVSAVAEGARTLADVKTSAAGLGLDSLGDWLLPLLLLGIATACAYIVWQRVRQRREGWS